MTDADVEGEEQEGRESLSTEKRDSLIAPHRSGLDAALAFLREFAGERCTMVAGGGEQCDPDAEFGCSYCKARRLEAAAALELKEARVYTEEIAREMTATAKRYPASGVRLAQALAASLTVAIKAERDGS